MALMARNWNFNGAGVRETSLVYLLSFKWCWFWFQSHLHSAHYVCLTLGTFSMHEFVLFVVNLLTQRRHQATTSSHIVICEIGTTYVFCNFLPDCLSTGSYPSQFSHTIVHIAGAATSKPWYTCEMKLLTCELQRPIRVRHCQIKVTVCYTIV